MSADARIRLAVVALLVPLAFAGCRQGMYDDARYEPYERSELFLDRSSARPLPAGTVARGLLAEDRLLATGVGPEGGFAASPVPLTHELLVRGRQRYDVFCAPCHDAVGTGNGMIVRRGYTQPPSLHEDRLRQIPDGHVFDVITRGLGVMPSYASQVPVADRWAIVAYVRALQLSQAAELESLPAPVRQLAERALGGAPAAGLDSSAEPRADAGGDLPATAGGEETVVPPGPDAASGAADGGPGR